MTTERAATLPGERKSDRRAAAEPEARAETKRILLYLLFSFALAWIPWIILNRTLGYDAWFNSVSRFYWLVNLTLFTPAAANVLTRLLTHERGSDTLLHLSLKGHLPQYALAVLVPIAARLLTGLFTTLCAGDLRGEAPLPGLNGTLALTVVLSAVSSAAVLTFITFGEEFGWRAYLYPKLEKKLGTPATVLAGGIIWGIWHAPLTVEGHNFGTHLPGHPFTGIALMCLFCICTGGFAMWLTKRTGSIFPAALWHAVNNFGGRAVSALTTRGVPEIREPDIGLTLLVLLPDLLLCGLFCILLCLRKKRGSA